MAALYITRRRTLYRMGVAGSLAGFSSWAALLAIPFLATAADSEYWKAELIYTTSVAGFIGLFCEAMARDRGSLWSAIRGCFAAAAAGSAGGGLSLLLSAKTPTHDWLNLLFTWILTGGFVGVVLGYRRYGFLPAHLLLSTMGGVVGGAFGAMLLNLAGERIPHWTHCFGLMATGASISFFSSYGVWLGRRATLRLLSPHGPAEWEMLKGTSLTFGSEFANGRGPHYHRVRDRSVAPVHGHVDWRDGVYFAYPDDSILNSAGNLVYRFEAGNPPVTRNCDYKLRDGDQIHMGVARFEFRLRIIALPLLVAVGMINGSVSQAQTLATAQRAELLRATGEQPMFRSHWNRVDASKTIQSIPVFSTEDAFRRTEVWEGDHQLRVCSVGVGSLPRRVTLLLVDVSGSMKDRTASSKTKFDAMIEASQRFTNQFVRGVDLVAIVPFESHDVIRRVEEAHFVESKQDLDAQLLAIPAPHGNTALFTAVRAAMDKLLRLRKEMGTSVQYLLVVMTDGMNDIRVGDDRGMETTVAPLEEYLRKSPIPVITVGFGDGSALNEDDLRRIASPDREGTRTYMRAANSEQLTTAFEDARRVQVDRIRVSFRPEQRSFNQLIHPHTFRVRFRLSPQQFLEGSFQWIPRQQNLAEGEASQEERECSTIAGLQWYLQPGLVFFVFGLLHFVLWRPVQRLIWGREDRANVLHERALTIR